MLKKTTGVRVERIVIKNLRNRWGSLTKKGVINLNLKIKEHSHHYWDMLHKFMPDYHDKIEWLKVNGNNLI